VLTKLLNFVGLWFLVWRSMALCQVNKVAVQWPVSTWMGNCLRAGRPSLYVYVLD